LALLATAGVAAGGAGVATGGVVLGALADGGVLEFVAGDGADDVPLPSEPPQALSRKAIPSRIADGDPKSNANAKKRGQ
jgi:hypothetical protein